MQYREDWPQAQKRTQAWWNGEIIDRVPFTVRAPKQGVPQQAVKPWQALINHPDNPELLFDAMQVYFRQTYFGGESFPYLNFNLGPGSTAAYMGIQPKVANNNVWFERETPLDWADILKLKLIEDEKWWQLTQTVTARAAAQSQGDYLIGMPDLNAPLNLLGFWRNTQVLLTDLFDSPDLVKQCSRLMTDAWHQCYDRLYPVQQQAQQGTADWLGIWYPGRGSNVQCDFAAMISPAMFAEFVCPDLQEQCRRLEYSLYHRDGPGQIPHLDLLLDIPELTGLQWTPGAGNPGVGSPQWYPLYKRIQKKGKLIALLGIRPDAIEPLLNEISPEGVLLSTIVESEEIARKLLDLLPQWTARNRTRVSV